MNTLEQDSVQSIKNGVVYDTATGEVIEDLNDLKTNTVTITNEPVQAISQSPVEELNKGLEAAKDSTLTTASTTENEEVSILDKYRELITDAAPILDPVSQEFVDIKDGDSKRYILLNYVNRYEREEGKVAEVEEQIKQLKEANAELFATLEVLEEHKAELESELNISKGKLCEAMDDFQVKNLVSAVHKYTKVKGKVTTTFKWKDFTEYEKEFVDEHAALLNKYLSTTYSNPYLRFYEPKVTKNRLEIIDE